MSECHPQTSMKVCPKKASSHMCAKSFKGITIHVLGSCGSGVETASSHQKVAGCPSVFGQGTEPQTAPDVLVGTLPCSHLYQCMNVCMNYCKPLGTKASFCCLFFFITDVILLRQNLAPTLPTCNSTSSLTDTVSWCVMLVVANVA